MPMITGTIDDGATAVELGVQDSDLQAIITVNGDQEGFEFKLQVEYERDSGDWYDTMGINQADGSLAYGLQSPDDAASLSFIINVAGATGVRLSPSDQSDGTANVLIKTGHFMDQNALMSMVSSQATGRVGLDNIPLNTLKYLAADGKNGAGAITLTGADVGDRVVMILGHVKANTGAHTFLVPTTPTDFEASITVDDEIQQVNVANWTTNTYVFVLAPALS